MDKKSVSYLALGILLGIIVTSGLFSVLSRSSGGETDQARKIVLKLSHVLDQSHPVHAAMEYMGGAPTPIPWGELYTALQRQVQRLQQSRCPLASLVRRSVQMHKDIYIHLVSEINSEILLQEGLILFRAGDCSLLTLAFGSDDQATI